MALVFHKESNRHMTDDDGGIPEYWKGESYLTLMDVASEMNAEIRGDILRKNHAFHDICNSFIGDNQELGCYLNEIGYLGIRSADGKHIRNFIRYHLNRIKSGMYSFAFMKKNSADVSEDAENLIFMMSIKCDPRKIIQSRIINIVVDRTGNV